MSYKIPLKTLRVCARHKVTLRSQSAGSDVFGISKHSGITCVNVSTYSPNFSSPGFFKKMTMSMKWFDYSKATLRAGGYKLYENIADRIHAEKFFDVLGLPDTMFSWFLVIELHVWMVMARLMAEKDGRFVRNVIVEAMWDDVRQRMKKLEVDTSSRVNETLHELSQQFGAAIIGYDEGLLGDDRCLAGALWRRILQQKHGSAMALEALVAYVRHQMHELDKLGREEIILSPDLKWIPLTDSI
ncbi:ubiquinol-cytochrome-c reductase complex assembly factor 1 [Ischnura elegans]|uniref:ubiquinol-cytochrome-c reductase complex assembly factor 1 n=1 Tax=Ischnura elegans TaxID=197161 RepID=UPI001ED88B03|nr:ubiquinol-cytochrome-c reductase complex assembly factor 1 [Ischnura elegans]